MSEFDRFRPSATEPVPDDEFARFRLSAVRPASKTVEDPFDVTPPPGLDPAAMITRMKAIDTEIGRGVPKEKLLQKLQTEGWKINKGLPPVPESPAAVPSWLPKIPYSGIEGAPTGEESPAPFREAIAAAARSSVAQPFIRQAYTGAGSFLKGGAALTRGVTDIGEYVGKPLGIPRSEVFDKAAQMWQDKGEELHQLAQEKGADFVDKMVGSAVGGGVPGVAEFMLNVPYYSFKGAIEADKRGDSQAWGAIVGGAKRYVLGKTLHAAGTLTKPLAIPAMGTVMGVQTAAEGGTPTETAEAVGTGMIFGATGAPGRTGAREVGRTIYEGIDRLIRSKKPITVEPPPVMPPAPPTPLLGAPITPDATPTPPERPPIVTPPPAASGTPEFYKAEAAKLPGDVRYVGDMGGRPMFQDEGGAGSFMKAPEETIPEALARARSRYETPKPAEPVSPVSPVPAADVTPAVQRAKERPIRSAFREDQVPDLPTVDSDITAARSNIADLEGEIAKGKDAGTIARMDIQDRLNKWNESLDALQSRRQEILAGKPPAPIDMAPPEAGRKKTATEISFEDARAAREPLPRSGEVAPPEPVQTPGQKFANVRDIKSKQKKEAAEPTLQQRILRAGGIKIDPAMRGEFAQYGLRQGEGALARLYRSEKHPGYKRAMGWDQWVETLIEDGTLREGAGISDLFEAIKKNKRPGAAISDEEFARSAAESAAKAARETVPENEIALGDSFRINGEKFKAVRYDEQGNLIVKDGYEKVVEANTGIQVDGGKEGITPVEIPAREQAVGDLTVKPTTSTDKQDAGWFDITDKAGALVDMKPTREEAIARAEQENKKPAAKAPKGQQDLINDKSFKLAEKPPPEGPAGEFKPSAAGAQDELFPGERAKYKAPEKGAPAPPPEGGLFAKGEEGFAPEGDFRKKPGEPIDEGKPMSRSSIAKFLSEKFDIPLRVGRFRSALGIFKVGPEVIRTRFAHDIEVISHEIGHALHKFLWPEARTGSGGLAAGPLRAFQDELIPIATKPRAGGSKTAEGFAEFIRKYVVNPDEAKQVAPKFFKFFEEQLDAKSPDSKAILLKARADYKRWLEQPALARVMGSINQTPAAGAALSFKKLYASVIDTFFPVEEITKEMAKVKRIDEVPANLNPYKLMHLLAGYKGKPDAWLEFKPYSFKTYKFSETAKSYKKIMDPIKENRDKFDAYVVSARSLEKGETRTGILDADARAVVEQMEREHPEFKQAKLEFKHFQNYLLRYLYDGGIINGEQFLRMRQANEDYVPFYRVMDYERAGGGVGSGASHEVKGSPIHRFKGSWRDIVSPTESIIKNTYTFIQAVEKNAIGKALVDLSKQKEGMGKFIEKIPADTQRIAVKDTELEDMLRKYGKWTETTQFQTTERVIRESIKDETGADIPAGERGTKLIKERAVEALKSRGYSEAEANTIVGRIASAKNETARSRIIERVTERATVRNTVREFGIDIPEGLAYIYRKAPHTPKGNVITVMERGKPTFYEVDERIYNAFHALDKEGANTLIRILSIPAKMLRVGATLTPEFSLGKNPIRDQWTAFINSKYGYIPGVDLAKGLFMAVKKNEDYWRWKIGGGEHSAMVSMDREYLDKTWKEVMRDRGVKADAIHLATHPIDVLRALSEYTEEATRLGEFRKGLKAELAAGKNLKTATQDAAYASREVTLPFSRMGAKTKAVNMIVAFWNANVQDLDKIHRQFKEYPLQTSIRTMAAITLPSVLLAIVNHSNKKIDEIAQWQKDIFWLVDVGPFVMRIPKPFIMGILFGSFPERIVNNIMDKDPRAFDGLLDSLSRGASPGWMPTFANPIIENWANKSTFTDRAIVPKAREDVLPQYQYAPYTTETAKKIGSLMAKIPGIKGSNLEAQIVSPAKFENMIRGWTGGLGMWALQAANASLETAGLVPARVEPSKQLADYPFIKAFVVRYPTADSESIQRFFDDYKEAETNLKSAKLLMKRGEFADASDLLLNEEVVRLVSVKTALTNAHRLVDLIYENPNILPDEKRRMIDETYLNMTAIAREGNKTLDAYKDRRKAQTP